MTYSGDINRSSRPAGFTAWLALAAVLLLQIESVAHEAQHSLSDLGDVCEICVQLDVGTATDSGSGIATLQPVPTNLSSDWTDAPVVLSAYRTPQLRAPPASI